MGRAVVGLDIGTSGVRAAEVTSGRGRPTLNRFGQVGLPDGAVQDGEVVDVDAVASALQELWRQAKFGSTKVVVGVANQKVVVRQIEVPWLAKDELRASLAFQVQDHIPMPVEQAILDSHTLEEFTREDGARMLRVLLVAASREMVSRTLQAVAKAGLAPSSVDLNSFAILRAEAHEGTNLSEVHAEALVDIGASVTNIVVHQAGAPRFVRILLLGGADITRALAERMGVPLSLAESIKQSMSLGPTGAPAPDSPASSALEQAGSAFLDEVRGSLDYYMTQPGAVRIDRLVLSGGGSMLGGLVERLAATTRLPVEAAHPFTGLDFGKTGLSDDQLAYVEPMVTVPVGLALRAAS